MGGGMGGGGGGHGHQGGKGGHSGNSSAPAPSGPARPAEKPVNQIEIIGVVKALDPATDRITIAYEPVDALNWPAGSMPFVAGKSAMLKSVTVGQKVRFKLESQQILEIKPF
jgi:Cu/Ag efflux protein CusF